MNRSKKRNDKELIFNKKNVMRSTGLSTITHSHSQHVAYVYMHLEYHKAFCIHFKLEERLKIATLSKKKEYFWFL